MADSRLPAKLKPFPGFVILEPYEIKKKIGGFEVPAEEGENTPQIGKIIIVGEPRPTEDLSLDWLHKYWPKADSIVAYKRYQDFPIQIGTKKYIAVAFEHLLFEIEDTK